MYPVFAADWALPFLFYARITHRPFISTGEADRDSLGIPHAGEKEKPDFPLH